MDVRLSQRGDGRWQADIVLPDGSDHAIGRTFGEALIELGVYLEKVRPR